MKLKDHLEELTVPAAAHLDPIAVELLRAWAACGSLHVSFRTNWDDPDTWGIFLVDLARHAARAYADQGKSSEADALEWIFSMFMKEWNRPTDAGQTMLADKQAH